MLDLETVLCKSLLCNYGWEVGADSVRRKEGKAEGGWAGQARLPPGLDGVWDTRGVVSASLVSL